MESLLCTRYCARVWDVLSLLPWETDLEMETCVQEICCRRLSGTTAMRKWGKPGLALQREVELWCSLQLRIGWQHRDWRWGDPSELSWIEAVRPDLCMLTLTSCWMWVNSWVGQLYSAVWNSRKETRLWADSRQQSQQLGELKPCPERDLDCTPWHLYHEVTNRWTGQNFCSHWVGSCSRWQRWV